MLVRIKSGDAWEDAEMDGQELESWFRENTKDGVVEGGIELFRDAAFEKSDGVDGVDWVMSDMSIDRDMERVDPAGADFKNFKKNPVVLWGHDHSIPAIGKVVNPKVKDGAVKGKVVFDSEDNDPFAGMIARKVKAGIISAGSIGFKPTTIEFVDEPKDATRLIHRKWELMEFSICNVPAHPGALAQRTEERADDEGIRKEIAILEGRIQALEVRISKQVETRKTYLDSLFADRSETSSDEKDADEISILFGPGETSTEKTEGDLAQLTGGSNG